MIERIIDRHVFGLWVCFGCFVVGALAIPLQLYYRGKVEAHWDIAYGNYKGLRCANACIRIKATEEFDRRLFEYAHLRIETNEDCGPRMRGYNEVQWSRVEHLYPGAYDRALAEAIDWDRNGPPATQE